MCVSFVCVCVCVCVTVCVSLCVCVCVCSGLDESVAQYVPLFHVNGVDGRKLLMLNHADLEKIGINKLGHQELVLEAVDLLRSLVGALGALSAVSESDPVVV